MVGQQAPGAVGKEPQIREKLIGELTPAELEAGQVLTRELMKPGNFAKALDAWQQQ